MTQRYYVGGPSNSGKSTFLLSLVEHLRLRRGRSASAIELDVWSHSYPAFRGEISFEGRPKTVGLDWDWQTPLLERLQEFQAAQEDLVFGDMPGKCIDEATEFMCEHGGPASAIVVSRTTEGLVAWTDFFTERGIHVAERFLTLKENDTPRLLHGMERKIVPDHPDVSAFGQLLTKTLVKL